MARYGGRVSLPQVPDWMLRGPGPLVGVAEDLSAAALELGRVEASLTALLADTATALGWRGDAAQAARARQARSGSQLDEAARALERAAAALDVLADALQSDGTRLAALVERHADLQRRSLLQQLAPVRLQVVLWALDDDAAEARQIAGHDVPPLVARLHEADQRAAALLAAAEQALVLVGAQAAADGWIGSATTTSVRGVLGRYDVVEDRADTQLVDWAAGLPDDPAGAAALRTRLVGLGPAQVADLLLRHPGLAQRLRGTLPDPARPGTDEAALAAALATEAGPAARSAAVAAVFAALPADRRRMLALLHPEVVGRLDGAPLAERAAANRVQIAAALEVERTSTTSRERAVALRSDTRADLDALLDRGGIAFEADDVGAARERGTDRTEYYRRLLYEEVPNAAPRPGRPPTTEHQVVFFDPRGDGRIAEMWGPIDAETRNVGVFVPGTTADLESFSGYSELARSFVRGDPTGRTTMIAWLGIDLPDAVGKDAVRSSYAETGGRALRDFTDGLLLAAELDVTVVGHSYGGAVVGVAEREGLVVDRVVHVESAGAGRDVRSVQDYAGTTGVDRYAMLAPGDLISASQGVQVGGLGHGAGPATLDGVTRLETGRYGPDHPDAGQMIEGGSSHSDVLTKGSTSWDNILGALRGTTVTPWTPPTVESTRVVPIGPFTWVDRDLSYPYEDPGFLGADQVPVP